MQSRNQQQTQIMVITYQYLFYQRMNVEVDLKELIANTFDMPYDEVDIFAKEVVIKTLLHQEEIDTLIENNLINWKLSRLNLVAHAILLFSIGEYKYVDEKISKAEIIDIAIKLSKQYLDDNQYKFVNALLDKVL